MTRRRVTTEQRRRRLAQRHLLGTVGQDPSVLDTADAMVVLHSSDPVTVYLSILARSPSADIETISDSLYEARELVRVHGMRRTLWVASRPVARDVVQATVPRLIRADRRRFAGILEKSGITVDGEQWIAEASTEVMAYLEEVKVSDTRTVGQALPHLTVGFEAAPGKPYSTTIAAHTRLMPLLGFEGRILRADPLGTWIASQYRWALPDHWLGHALVDDLSPEQEWESQVAMIDRYLWAFGPVTMTDLTWWTGWPARLMAKILAEVGAVEVDLDDGDGQGWMAADDDLDQPSTDDEPWEAVLPGLDPTTMGWKERDWYLDPDVVTQLFDRNGNAGPTIWIDGRIVGAWAQRDDGELVYEMLCDVGRDRIDSVERALDSLGTKLGDTRFKLRFPSPINARLRS